MNTTNLLTDYIISGVLGILCILIPYLMIDNSLLVSILTIEIKNVTIIAVFVTISSYTFGVLYNQFADIFENIYFKIFSISVISTSETKLKTDLGIDHHYALQFIVCKSQSAYDYISFRRTMIRIIRAILSMTVLLPIFHLITSIILSVYGRILNFSLQNLTACLVSFILSYFIGNSLAKLYKGYYSAITNFYIAIKE
jgi:hypothetical protein